ncbi:hypothetical protein EJ069_10280 [Mesorhizobium sp. M2A.F.Ca.ET.043.05.1.1]|uniref:hypothetical protein n=1 Tax=Mesorhizobium sp. M2A.F.Ca.ET.043.05.1.1 TaxID=2493671 RepID=UPI000F750074|nr:hypothetical protein [Mesorhizobium sp. M2A.F.Ca.ET.043.05.1.1]AZO15081.1 hypothetical protein EJ069_10280 [Mesorhizobium sp. M2A.F.Ca.ET.043.05.1.1]
MQTPALMAKLDAQDRRLARIVSVDGKLVSSGDYTIERHDGTILVQPDFPDALRIIAIPTGKYVAMNASDDGEDTVALVDEVRATGVYPVETNWTDSEDRLWCETLLVPRIEFDRINVPFLVDALPEPEIATAEPEPETTPVASDLDAAPPMSERETRDAIAEVEAYQAKLPDKEAPAKSNVVPFRGMRGLVDDVLKEWGLKE